MDKAVKYQAWHKAHQKMYGVMMLTFSPINDDVTLVMLRSGPGSAFSASLQEIELRAFTGSFDINGKEIWQGDIVTWGNYKDIPQTRKYIRGVTWHDDRAMFLPNEMHGEVEVVGNVYENPQLLNRHA